MLWGYSGGFFRGPFLWQRAVNGENIILPGCDEKDKEYPIYAVVLGYSVQIIEALAYQPHGGSL